MRLLIATGNAHKTEEFRTILGADFEVVDLRSLPGFEPPVENGRTFEENAEIKAAAASLVFGGLVLADDSGLEVDALGGEPGTRSARYAGEGATDARNREKLRVALAAAGLAASPGRFRCAIAAALHGKVLRTWSGAVDGEVRAEERGSGGFGYDAMFVPEGYTETFAELPGEVKNRLSHRARALALAMDGFRDLQV